MAHGLVCLASTLNGHSKKRKKALDEVALVAAHNKPYFLFQYLWFYYLRLVFMALHLFIDLSEFKFETGKGM
jgi:hypothetical protein